MKFGVKTFFDKNFAEYFRNKADFIEVMAIPGEDYSFLKNYPLPVVIHACHSDFGVNLADKNSNEKNFEAVEFAKKLADKFNSKKVILHPGNLINKNCSVRNSLEIIEKLDDRFILENCFSNNTLCGTPEEMESFLLKSNKKFCFDFSHALIMSKLIGKNYKEFISEFISLKPKHFHVSGQNFNSLVDQHLSFEDSDFDFSEFLKKIPSDSEITLETSVDKEKVERDLIHIRGLFR